MFHVYRCREASLERALLCGSRVEPPSHTTPGFERDCAARKLWRQYEQQPARPAVTNQDLHRFAAQRSERYCL